jgi:hypothetical protein
LIKKLQLIKKMIDEFAAKGGHNAKIGVTKGKRKI